MPPLLCPLTPAALRGHPVALHCATLAQYRVSQEKCNLLLQTPNSYSLRLNSRCWWWSRYESPVCEPARGDTSIFMLLYRSPKNLHIQAFLHSLLWASTRWPRRNCLFSPPATASPFLPGPWTRPRGWRLSSCSTSSTSWWLTQGSPGGRSSPLEDSPRHPVFQIPILRDPIFSSFKFPRAVSIPAGLILAWRGRNWREK